MYEQSAGPPNFVGLCWDIGNVPRRRQCDDDPRHASTTYDACLSSTIVYSILVDKRSIRRPILVYGLRYSSTDFDTRVYFPRNLPIHILVPVSVASVASIARDSHSLILSCAHIVFDCARLEHRYTAHLPLSYILTVHFYRKAESLYSSS